jgi:hypothetical protein
VRVGGATLNRDLKGWMCMASSGKKKTTMAKLTRERRLRERRIDKQARKDARRLNPPGPDDQPAEVVAANSELIDVEEPRDADDDGVSADG